MANKHELNIKKVIATLKNKINFLNWYISLLETNLLKLLQTF